MSLKYVKNLLWAFLFDIYIFSKATPDNTDNRFYQSMFSPGPTNTR